MNETDLDAAYAVCGRVVVRRLGPERLLVPVSGLAAGGCIYPLNETALLVWNALAGGKTIRQAAEELSVLYTVDEAAALADCTACAHSFLREKLIEAI